ncbi:MAG: carboxypeptidase M32 [Rhodovibrionaceae bacterium]
MSGGIENYRELEQRFRRLNALREAEGLLHWDGATLMPEGGAEARSEQLAALGVLGHELLTHGRTGELLDAAEAELNGGDPWRAANLREMRREWRHATALDSAFVEALSKACNRCEMIWREARPKSDFALVLPALREVLALTREAAARKAEVFGCSPYDALLDLYEPGLQAARIDAVFAQVESFLPGLLEEVLECQAAAPAARMPEGPFPVARQEALARQVMAQVGFDFRHGRLDTSLHPFCGGVPEDVRITTRYDDADFLTSLSGVLHETGHALYERGLPADWRLQPVGKARGMMLHESQSLLIEMQACRSPEFIGYLAPLARAAFEGEGAVWEAENLLRLVNRVRPDFIRVDADEVTYPAHVILRTRLEQALLSGDLDPAELPGAWNEAMQRLLGITPPDDRRGCLQDIHWYDGAFGYFPTYSLGAMTAAQLFAAARAARPEIPAALARGDFAPLLAWLREKVHGLGSSLSGEEIVAAATGAPLDPRVFEAHLRRRYLGAA